jgi:type IX secretion system PorP/SprF family membrane protein
MRYFILIVINLLALAGFSQSNIRLNNFWENTFYVNPSSIYNDYYFTLSTALRDQWIKFPGAPITGYFTAAAYSDRYKSQLGLKFFYDRIGYTSLNNISFSYAYSIKFDNDHYLNFGLAQSLQNVSYDMEKANTETIGDPAIYKNLTKVNNYNADFGAELLGKILGKHYLLGFSSQNMVSLFTKKQLLQTNTNFLYGILEINTKSPFYFNLGFCLFQNEQLFQGELYGSAYYYLGHNYDIKVGLLYRTKKEGALLFSYDFSNRMRLLLSYDVFFGSISHSSYGSIEIMLLWKFGLIPGCSHCNRNLKTKPTVNYN